MLRFREDAEALRRWWGCWGPRSWNNSPVVTQPTKWQKQDLSWGLSYSNLLLIADYTASFLENSAWLAPVPALEGVGNPSPLIFICGTGSSAVPSGQGCQKGCRHWTCQNLPLCPPAGLPKALSSSFQRQGGECQAGEGPGWAVTASVLQKRCPSPDLSLQLLVRSHANASLTLERAQTLESTVVWWWFSCSVLSNSYNPMDSSPPGSSVHGISQARILEWGAISFSRGSSWPRDWMCIPCITGRLFTNEPPGKNQQSCVQFLNVFELLVYFPWASVLIFKIEITPANRFITAIFLDSIYLC